MDERELKFSKLINEHKSTIYSVCYMFSDDSDEVSDLFQEVLINVWNGLDSFSGKSDIKTWLWRVALNTCINVDRKKKRRRDNVRLTMDIDLYQDQDTDTRQVAQLRDRINRLQPFDRAIVLLWLENMSYDEIGAIVGITAKNVGVRLFRIKEQLKSM